MRAIAAGVIACGLTLTAGPGAAWAAPDGGTYTAPENAVEMWVDVEYARDAKPRGLTAVIDGADAPLTDSPSGSTLVMPVQGGESYDVALTADTNADVLLAITFAHANGTILSEMDYDVTVGPDGQTSGQDDGDDGSHGQDAKPEDDGSTPLTDGDAGDKPTQDGTSQSAPQEDVQQSDAAKDKTTMASTGARIAGMAAAVILLAAIGSILALIRRAHKRGDR